MNWANYLIQINLYLMLFYGFYFLFLRNETFFQLNRIYLISSAIASFCIPIMYFDWVRSFFITEQVQNSWTGVSFIINEGFVTPLEETFSLGDYLTLIYLIVTPILTLRLLFNFLNVWKLLRSDSTPEAFSFFHKIKINSSLPNRETILKHEKAHAQQLHSADVLLFEIIHILNWFNPICYFYKNSIKHIHEFIADDIAMQSEANKRDYALLLFSKSFGVKPQKLVNTFFNQSLLKRRIQMLQKQKSRKTAILKYGLSVPLFFVALIFSSATISNNKTIKSITKKVEPNLTVQELIAPTIPSKILEVVKKVETTKTFSEDTIKIPNQNGSITLDNTKPALYILDGKEVSASDVKLLDANTITSVEVLKGERALKRYGDKAKDGAVIIKTKDYASHQEEKEIRIIKLNGDKEIVIDGKPLDKTEKHNIIITRSGSKLDTEELSGKEVIVDGNQVRVYKLAPSKEDSKKRGKAKKPMDKEEETHFFYTNPNTDNKEKEVVIIRKIERADGENTVIRELKNDNKEIKTRIYVGGSNSENKPLIYIDGKEESSKLMKDISPETIDKINVLKGEKATQKYGEKAKNGVIEITLKKK